MVLVWGAPENDIERGRKVMKQRIQLQRSPQMLLDFTCSHITIQSQLWWGEINKMTLCLVYKKKTLIRYKFPHIFTSQRQVIGFLAPSVCARSRIINLDSPNKLLWKLISFWIFMPWCATDRVSIESYGCPPPLFLSGAEIWSETAYLMYLEHLCRLVSSITISNCRLWW
jgi:hypothetical protein